MQKSVFISYGHGEFDNVVRRLANDLRNIGFNVFLDVDYLKQGDWEQVIDNHILASRFFVYLVSKRSTAKEGYCLNELCRAGENNSIIIPVILEDAKIPLSINKLQRLSLKDCLNPNKEIIEVKYKDFLLNISAILSGNVQLGFSNDDVRLESLLKPISSKDFLFRYYQSFCGRRDAFARFEDFVKSNKNYFWISANAGCGKTALSSMLIWKYPEYIGAAHFCKFNNSDRANPKFIITSIAYQLATIIPEYKKKLVELMGLETVFEKNSTRIFEYLIIEPLSDIKLERPLVVIIDALDECSWRGENEICSLLQRVRERIPSWLKFVLTSRNEADIRRYLSSISMTYELSETENEDDLREYYQKEFPEAGASKIESLLAKSEGSFLYASEIIKQIKDEHLSLEDINFFPVGIHGFFNDWFVRLFGGEIECKVSFEKVKPILEFLCISKEPANIEFLEDYLNVDEYDLKNTLSYISGLFPIKNQCIEPLHKSLIDWLTDNSDVAHVYYISKKSGYKRLLKYIKEKYDNKEYNNEYVMKYYSDTLISLNMYEELFNILNNYELQNTIIKELEFDFGLERYLHDLENLHRLKPDLCVQSLGNETFIKIFSDNRRLLYNSGMFFMLKNIGLSIVLRSENQYWGVEGEIGKVFYYYIVEDFHKAIKKAKTLLTTNEEVKKDLILCSELYNVKGLSERKLVLFDDALESFEKCIECVESCEEVDRDNSDLEFELSLAYLITSKINMHMLDFSSSNRNAKKAIKVLTRKIEEMPNSDKKTSNILFLAEDYRVLANSYIWQNELELAEEKLKNCEEIYRRYNSSVDRYFIRYKYTSLLLKIMSKDYIGVIDDLRHLLEKEAKGAYDKGTLNYYIALCIYLYNSNDEEALKEGLEYAKKGLDIFDSIDSYLEKAECDLIARKIAKLINVKYLGDSDDEEYIDEWLEHIDEIIEGVKC